MNTLPVKHWDRIMRSETRRKRTLEIMEAAYALLREKGYRATSMLAVAKRAGASNATLYDWFDSKQELFSAMVAENAREAAGLLHRSIADGQDARATLRAVGPVLLDVVAGDRAIALNRAAAADADETGKLGRAIARAGRETIVPMLRDVLVGAQKRGEIGPGDIAIMAETYVALLIGDLQIRRVIGVKDPLTEQERTARAERACMAFFTLFPPTGGEPRETQENERCPPNSC